MIALAPRAAPRAVFYPSRSAARRLVVVPPGIYWNLSLLEFCTRMYGTPRDAAVDLVLSRGAFFYSRSTSLYALRTGIWPSMNNPPGLLVEAGSRLQGAGGRGGNAVVGPPFSLPGSAGGGALLVEANFRIHDGSAGEIWSGGGGGGAGGPRTSFFGIAAGGGGGGAGTNAGGGGSGYSNGSPGTSEAGGAGGAPFFPAGAGGTGGGPGLAGSAGAAGNAGAGGAGGAAGVAIMNVSMLDFGTSTLDIRGAQVW